MTSASGHGACKPRDGHWKSSSYLQAQARKRGHHEEEPKKNVLCTGEKKINNAGKIHVA